MLNYSVNETISSSDFMLSVTCGVIGALGLPGNFFLMILILIDYKKRKPHEWLIFSLALGDFILCLNNVCLEAYFLIHYDHIECKIAGAVDYTFAVLSLLTPPLVAYNRYLSLYDNAKYLRVFTNFNVLIMFIVLILFSAFWIFPFMITGNLGKDDLGLCGTQNKTPLLGAFGSGMFISVSIAYVFLVYFSYKVILKIRNHKKSTSSGQSQLQSRLIAESQDIITTMLIISLVPLAAQFPGAITKFLQIFVPRFERWIGSALVALFPLTSAVNAYITVYVVRDYRRKVIRMIRRQHTVAPSVSMLRGGIGQQQQEGGGGSVKG